MRAQRRGLWRRFCGVRTTSERAAVPGHDGVWVAAGYSGHGNVFGVLCGELAAAALAGKDDALLELFSPARLVHDTPAPAG